MRNCLNSAGLKLAVLLTALSVMIMLAAGTMFVYAEPAEEPVKIGSYEDLAAFIQGVNDGSIDAAQDAVLTADIVVPETVGNGWVPLAKDQDHEYQGDFDGDGHSITGIKIDRSAVYPDPWKTGVEVGSYTALISFLGEDGVVQELHVEADITDVNCVAGIVSQNAGSIVDCEFKGNLTSNIYPNSGSGRSYYYPDGAFDDTSSESGGIAALNMGVIERCKTLEGTKIHHGGIHCGGIAGSQLEGGFIYNCENNAEISVGDTSYKVHGLFVGGAGGIAGFQGFSFDYGEDAAKPFDPSERPLIMHCINNGKITCENCTGGICGESSSGDIISCENYGAVEKVERMWGGGIVGYAGTDIRLTDKNMCQISGCTNYGSINHSTWDSKAGYSGMYKGTYIGGIAGEVEDAYDNDGGQAHIRFFQNTNKATTVCGKFSVGGVIGYLVNGADFTDPSDPSTKISYVYELVNAGNRVFGSDSLGGVVGACPGVISDTASYSKVILCPESEEDYCFAGGVTGDLSSTGLCVSSYNIGEVKPYSIKSFDEPVWLIGGVTGDAGSDEQVAGSYYCYETSSHVLGIVGSWYEEDNYGYLPLSDMGGKAAGEKMLQLFDRSTSLHKDTVWNTVDNVEIDGTTYYMTPQMDWCPFTFDELHDKGNLVKHYPFNITETTATAPDSEYDGKAQDLGIKVMMGGVELSPDLYYIKSIEWTDSDSEYPEYQPVDSFKEVGHYFITIEAVEGSHYYGSTYIHCDMKKGTQKIKSVTPAKKTIKRGKSFQLKTTLSAGDGKITYKKTSGNKNITVTKAGKVKTTKKLKKGKTYKITVKVSVAATGNYNAAETTRKIQVKIKK